MIEHDYLLKNLFYSKETGEFFWVSPRKGAPKNKQAGNVSKAHKYRTICIDGKWYRAHRLAWFWVTGKWPDVDIDHIDRNKSNNSWANLRLASRSQNALNVSIKKSNSSGVTGVSWDSARGKWLAQIRINGKKINLGRYIDKDDAVSAWNKAAISDNPEFRLLNNAN